MEIIDAEARGDHGIIFKKIGPELRVVDGGFKTTIPAQAVAVSNKFGLTFFIHSEGFCVAYTQKLVEASQNLLKSPKNGVNAQERSVASISVHALQSLTLSKDELVIAACTEDEIYFYSVPVLVEKENAEDRALLKSLRLKVGVKCLEWSKSQNNVILVLSREGKLIVGSFTSELKPVANEVEAADWSPDGEFLCYVTNDMHLHTCKADLSESSTSKLPSKIFGEASSCGPGAYVDMVKWVCLDSILVSSVHTDADGQEDDHWLFLLVSSQGHMAQNRDGTKVLSFDQFFTSIDAYILPPCTGPYLLASYIQSWKVIIASSRRCIDDHISLLGWMDESVKIDACKFELVDDRFTPRIELQASGDDNCVVGLAVDQTTSSIQLPALDGETGEKLPPGPVLLCMTIEGNLSLFSAARTDVKWNNTQVVTTPMQVPSVEKVPIFHSLQMGSKASGEKIQGEGIQIDKAVGEKPNGFQVAEKFQGAVSHEISNEKTKEQVERRLHRDVQEKAFVPQPQKNLFSAWDSGGIKIARPNNVALKQPASPEVSNAKRSDGDKKPTDLGREQKRMPESPVSEMESDFSKELNKIKLMAGEIDELMASIEGKPIPRKSESKALFTKSLMENIESETQNLSLQCRNFQEKLISQRQNINDLRDESMQVDAWRVYLQSVIEQVSDVRYQELWHKQKLHPEMDAMRKRILQMDQSLKQQIAELEGHLHNLKLSDWQKKQQPLKAQAFSTSLSSENFRRIQSLYETVNSQMLVAQQLDHRLRELIEALYLPVESREEIESLIELSKGNLECVALGEESFKKMSDSCTRKKTSVDSAEFKIFSPTRTSINMSLQTPTKLDSSSGMRTGLQDSTRRRRDSVDKLWVDVGAAKTTVKRTAPAKHFETLKTPPKHGVSVMEAVQPLHAKQLGRSPQHYYQEGTEDTRKTADIQPLIPERASPSLKVGRRTVSPNHMHKVPASTKMPTTTLFGGDTFAGPLLNMSTTASLTSISAPLKETVVSEAQTSKAFEVPTLSNVSRPIASQGISKLGTESVQVPLKTDGTSKAFEVPTLPNVSRPIASQGLFKLGTESVQVPPRKDGTVLKDTWGFSGGGMTGRFEVPLSQAQQSSLLNPPLKSLHPQELKGEGITELENVKSGNLAFEVQAKTYESNAFQEPAASASSVSEGISISVSSSLQGMGSISANQESKGKPAITPVNVPKLEVAPVTSLPMSISSPLVAVTSPAMASTATVVSATSMHSSTISSTLSSPSTSFPFKVPSFPSDSLLQAPQLLETTASPVMAQGPPSVSDEEDMEEEENTTVDVGATSFAGFGIGSAVSPAGTQMSRPFGVSTLWNQSISAASSLSVPAGQLFKPSSFSIPAAESTSQQASSSSLFKPASFSIASSQSTSQQQGATSLFGSSFTSATGAGFGVASTPFVSSTPQPLSPFGQQTPTASGGGQQILGSALGTFGQTRQIGSPFGVSSPAGFGFVNPSPSGGGFAGVASTGAGFAGVTPSGGGFAGVASTGGGFASVASTGGGFAGVAAASGGFAGVASMGGGFAGVASASGSGFAGATAGSGFAGFSSASAFAAPGAASSAIGGFGAFSGGFGTSANPGIFSQMRK